MQRGRQSPEEEEKRKVVKLVRIKKAISVPFRKFGNVKQIREGLTKDLEIAWLQKNGNARKDLSLVYSGGGA